MHLSTRFVSMNILNLFLLPFLKYRYPARLPMMQIRSEGGVRQILRENGIRLAERATSAVRVPSELQRLFK
jgi:hypothetical protein